MAISFKHYSENSTLYVTTTGFDESIEDTQKFITDILTICQSQEIHKVLSDERDLVYNLSVINTYQLAEFTAKNAPKIAKIALVTTKEQMKDAQFWEDVVFNRGLSVRVFTDYDQANSWIQNID